MREQALNWRGVPSGDPAPYVTHVSLNADLLLHSALHPTSLLWQSSTLLLWVQGSLLRHCYALYCKLLECTMYIRRCGSHLISFQRIKAQSCCYKQAYYPLFVHHPLHGTFSHGTKCVQINSLELIQRGCI